MNEAPLYLAYLELVRLQLSGFPVKKEIIESIEKELERTFPEFLRWYELVELMQ